MKKWLLGVLVLICALVLVVPMAEPALASDTNRFKAVGAEAYWSVYDPVSGNYTDIWVGAAAELNQQPPGTPQAVRYVMVDVLRHRGPPEDPYAEVFVEVICQGEIPAGSLVIDPKLSSVSLSATGLPGFRVDWIQQTVIEVNLDVTVEWTAIGHFMREGETYHYKGPDAIFNSHGAAKGRDASAEGTLSYDSTSIELAASPESFIFSASSGSVEVSR